MHKIALEPAIIKELNCNCPVGEIQSLVAPTAEDKWTEEKSRALKCLQLMEIVKLNWSVVLKGIVDRLQADEIETTEAMGLFDALFDVFERLPAKSKAASAEIVGDTSFYMHCGEWSAATDAVASLVALQVLAENVGRAPPTEPEKKGHTILQSVFTGNDKSEDVVNEYVGIMVERPGLSLLRVTITQRSALGVFFESVLKSLAEREDVAIALPVSLYLEQFDILDETMSSGVDSLTANLLKSNEFKQELAKIEVKPEHAAAHCALIQAGAFETNAYREHVVEFLRSVDEKTWYEVIRQENELYDLLGFVGKLAFRSKCELSQT